MVCCVREKHEVFMCYGNALPVGGDNDGTNRNVSSINSAVEE